MIKSLVIALALALPAAAQTSGPPAGTPPVAPAPRTHSDYYVPLYGGVAGIAIPIGRISEDHGAGYALGGLIEYGVAGQAYSLRGEALYQRYPLKSGRTTGSDANIFNVGATVIYRLQQATAQTYLAGGIAIYKATDEGTRPGFNVGTGVEIPLTGFTATAEIRLHAMLADVRPMLTLPLTVGVRF